MKRLLIVGTTQESHIGGCFARAAASRSLQVEVCDTAQAGSSSSLLTRVFWHALNKRPVKLHRFGQQVIAQCKAFQPDLILATGIAPLTAEVLKTLKAMSVPCVNYLTDDPWNPAHKTKRFLKALPEYDFVFSPRRANLEELQQLGCPQVHYLPFGYDPARHFPEPLGTTSEATPFACDVIFAGHADADRVPYLEALQKQGLDVHIHGACWERFAQLQAVRAQLIDPQEMRLAIAGAKMALCLVRKANRDGNAMRSFEVPAMGACCLMEDTPEHREVFGEDMDCVAYFNSIDEMQRKAQFLLEQPEQRDALAQRVQVRMQKGKHTYADRLQTILEEVQSR